MLWQYDAPCPKYDAEFQKLLTNPDPQTEFYKYNQQHKKLYEYMSQYSGEVIIYIRFQCVVFHPYPNISIGTIEFDKPGTCRRFARYSIC